MAGAAGPALVALAAHAAASKRARSPSTARTCARRRARCARASAWCFVAARRRSPSKIGPRTSRSRSSTRTRHLIVIDKPAGMVVHPATSHQAGTLVNALLHHCGDSLARRRRRAAPGDRASARQGHLGRHGRGQGRADAGGAAGAVPRARSSSGRYLALVEGVVAERGTLQDASTGAIRAIARSSRRRWRRASARSRTGAVRERLPGASLVEVSLETGRTHQIRVHFSRSRPSAARRPDLRAAAARGAAARRGQGARAAGAARARARHHASGDGREAALVDASRRPTCRRRSRRCARRNSDIAVRLSTRRGGARGLTARRRASRGVAPGVLMRGPTSRRMRCARLA